MWSINLKESLIRNHYSIQSSYYDNNLIVFLFIYFQSLMKKVIAICLLMSIFLTVHAEENLLLNKDDNIIIDPNSWSKYIFDQTLTNEHSNCQSELEATDWYFFNAEKTQIIHALNCNMYVIDSTTNTSTEINTTNTWENQINSWTWSTETTTETTETTESIKEEIQYSEELISAIKWMYENELTKFSTPEAYDPTWLFTREQGAKFATQGAKVIWYKNSDSYECSFNDMDWAHEWLKSRILQSCNEWIFKWDNWFFMPKESLTYWQTLTIIVKMYQDWKASDQSDPWREVYYNKAIWLWLTSWLNISKENINETTTRGDIAILLYRLYKTKSNLNTNTEIKNEKIEKDIFINNSINNESKSFLDDPELNQAIWRMYDNRITAHNNISDYNPTWTLQRQHASQFLSVFHQNFFTQIKQEIPEKCFFNDLESANSNFRSYILYSCQEWILYWYEWNFSPLDNITKAEFIAGLINMLEIKVDTTWLEWREWYADKAVELWLIKYNEKESFLNPITRYEVAIQLYRFYIKYKFLKHLETSQWPSNNVVSVFDDSKWEILDKLREKKISIDTKKLLNDEGSIGIIELFDNKKYILQKDWSATIYTDSINWFWSLYDIETNTKVWTANFLVDINTNLIIFWTIRINIDTYKSYDVNPSQFTTAYYILKLINDASQTN